MTPGKLIAVGSSDDGGYRFTFPVDLSELPLDGLQQYLRNARHIVADLELEVARRSHATPAASDSDRAVPLDEAVALLGMTWSYLERKSNYTKLGGFVDADGHVKFMLSDIRRHQTTRRKVALLT